MRRQVCILAMTVDRNGRGRRQPEAVAKGVARRCSDVWLGYDTVAIFFALQGGKSKGKGKASAEPKESLEPKAPKDMWNVKCFKCKRFGHVIAECPQE